MQGMNVERFTRAGFSDVQADALVASISELHTFNFVTRDEFQQTLAAADRKWKRQRWRAALLVMGLVVLSVLFRH